MAESASEMEARWQKFWEENRIFRTERREGHPKFYCLDMFPYPSGSGLHVGHPEGYTATDIISRYKRMKGFDVLHPMGWDAFGLPAEQYAMQTGTHPAETTRKNLKVFKRQLSALGFSYDWEREINTTDIDYVRWTQWIFLQLFKKGLAFQSKIPVNWCPELGTTLANEEVIDGLSERGNHPVERRPLRQWQLKITHYADRLASDLSGLDWPETREKQRDWIGRSEGASVRFQLVGRKNEDGEPLSLEVFTTRPDTLFGSTYMVIAPDHPLTKSLCSPAQREEVESYILAAAKKSERERTANKVKSGVFTGAMATNPVTGKEIPIYTADYVLGAYGTGAIMAVPAHDTRDFEFAKSFDLPIVQVVSKDGKANTLLKTAFTDPGTALGSGMLDGLKTEEAKAKMLDYLEAEGFGARRVNYKLRDWVFSRQRYWGEPIPIYFPVKTEGDPTKGDPHEIDYETPIAVDESELPLKLPELQDYKPGDPAGVLMKAIEWRFFQKDGEWFARETNTMPQWAGSCWYYLRYLDPRNNEEIFSQKSYDDWMPVDLYMGGAEHAVLHLLYARFWHKVLFDCGVVKDTEPFTKLVHQGMILGMVYRYYLAMDPKAAVLAIGGDDKQIQADKERGAFEHLETGERYEAHYLVESQIITVDGKPTHPEHGVTLLPVAEKMSKARGNVVNPDDVIAEFGADTLRIYEMFMGPLEQVKPWQTSGLQGVRRFLDRLETSSRRALLDEVLGEETEKLLHRTLKKVTEDIEALRFNTAVSSMMIYVNHLVGLKKVPVSALVDFLKVLCPFAPHLAEEMFSLLVGAGVRERRAHVLCLSQEAWPAWDDSLCVDNVVTLPIQVNGKVKARIEIARDASESDVRAATLELEIIQKLIAGKELKKFIFVPGRICNLILR